ncbi:MAG: dienelactone hydrolase family protein [Vulcanimicrobiaceae bacterium]
MGEMIEYKRPDGKTAPGYLALPKDPANAPGIVVIEEWWGVTDYMKSVADELAEHGYRALVPDLFRGRTAAVGDEATHLLEGLDFADASSQDVRGAAQYLKQQGGKVGVIGFCVGGALAFIAAMHVPDIDAAVIFYGFPPPEAGDPATIKIPLLCHFAKKDEFFDPKHVEWIESRLKAGNVKYELYWYDAEHAFCNPNPLGKSGLGHYNPEAAKLAWERTYDFLKRTL